MAKGIDLSHYKTVHDWQAIKDDGYEFCILKATQGLSFVDETCNPYAIGAKSVELLLGLFHYGEPDSDPIAQAEHFKSIINEVAKQVKIDLIPILDLEEAPEGVDLVEWTRSFVDAMGCKVGLYTGDTFIRDNRLIGLSDMPLWVARYSSNPPYKFRDGGWSHYAIWQYSESGTVLGIEGENNIDLNVADYLDEFLVEEEEQVDKVNVTLNGQPMDDGIFYDGHSYIPARNILSAIGYKVNWDADTKTVDIRKKCDCCKECDCKE